MRVTDVYHWQRQLQSTVGFVVISPDSTKSPEAVELSVMSSDSTRLIVVGLAVPMDTTVGGALSTVPVKVWSSAGLDGISATVP